MDTMALAQTDGSKANARADHLFSIFTPFQLTDDSHREEVVNFLDVPTQSAHPMRYDTPQEVSLQLKALQLKKTRGPDDIDNRAAKFLLRKGVS